MSPYHQSLADFLAMGGYGDFVWTAYGIVALTLVLNAVVPILQHRRLKASLRHRIQAEAGEDRSSA